MQASADTFNSRKREKETTAWDFLAREWKNSLLAPGRGGRAAEGGLEVEREEVASQMQCPVPARLWAPLWLALLALP